MNASATTQDQSVERDKQQRPMTACIAVSADPLTYGHIWLIQEALKVFQEVIISVEQVSTEGYMFSFEERYQMVKKYYEQATRVTVVKNPQGHPAYQVAAMLGAHCCLRGVRDSEDVVQSRNIEEDLRQKKVPFPTMHLLSPSGLREVNCVNVQRVLKEKQDIQKLKHMVPESVYQLCAKKYEELWAGEIH